MSSYEIGTAWLQIVPSFQGVAETIDAEASKWGSDSGETFAETFKARVDAALASLPDAKVGLDATEADEKLAQIRAELETLSGQTIGVDVSDAEATAKIEEIRAELYSLDLNDPDILVRADTADAELKLAAVAAEADAARLSLTGLGDGSEGAGAGLEGAGADAAEFTGEINLLVVGIGALVVALLPIGGLALGAFAALPALIAGAVSGLGALYAGLEPIVTTLEAFSAKGKATTAAGGGSGASTALANAEAQRNAAYSVEQATEALTNAQVSGAQAVTNAQKAAAAATLQANQNVIQSEQALVNAERAVTEAQYNEQQAQEAVIAARQAAQNQLQDYTDQLADNAISQQQDQLNLTEAQAAYQSAIAPGSTATSDQQQQAYIDLEQAQQALQDLNDQNSQLSATASAAFAAGVDGAQGVLDAEHNLQTATQAVTDAITAQQTAQQNVASATAAAAAQIITNQQNIAAAQQKNAQGVQNAEKALEQALANQKDAIERSKLPIAEAGGAVNTYASDFDKLTPAGQKFVDFVEKTLMPAFTGISDVAQDGLLPGLEGGLSDMLPFFKSLTTFIWAAAKGLGDFVQDLGEFAGSSSGLSQIQDMFANGDSFMTDVGKAADIFFQAFVGVGAQSAPIVNALGNGLVNIAKAFLNWVNDGGFQGFLTWLQQNGPRLVSDLAEFLGGFGKLAVALAPLGEYLDDFIGFLSKLVGWVSENWSRFGLLASVIGAVGLAILAIVGGPITLVIGAIALLVIGILTLADHWQEVWSNIKQWSSDAWNFLNSNLFQPIGNFFSNTIPHAFDNFISFCKSLPGRALSALGDFAEYVWGALVIDNEWLVEHIGDPILNFFTGLPDKIGTAAEHMWDGIEAAFVTMLNALIDVWNDLHFKLPSFNLGPFHFGGETIGMPPIPTIPVPQYHTGGVVQGPAGVEQLALLMPGEIVTPANTVRGLTLAGPGVGNILNLAITVDDASNIAKIQRTVVDAFDQFSRELQSTQAA